MNNMTKSDIADYIISNRDHYVDLFKDKINEREMLLMEHPEFKDEIDISLRTLIKRGIVNHVTKELAIDSESVYNVVDGLRIFALMEIYP